ncbi:hypothetical protein ACLKA6_018725 [Drosophila palustris]
MSESENQSLDNDDLELEEQFILRLPKDIAEEVLKSVQNGTIHEKMTIQLDSELRYGEVRVNDQVLHAKFVDLPTVVESYKTADNVNLYKTADINQMLVCSTEPVQDNQEAEKLLGKELEKLLESESEEDKENKDKDQVPKEAAKEAAKQAAKDIPKVDEKFLWPHGLTPPTRNLRRRRIANAMKGKNAESAEQDVLKEVKYLLRMDGEAARIEYAVVEDDGEPDESYSDGTESDDEDIDEMIERLL